MRLTDIAQQWLKETLRTGDTAIDATLGNGFDALFLARQIGASGQLYGFDVQQQALRQSEQLLMHEPCPKTFFLQGHEHMTSVLPPETKGRIQAVMFNLGWLPGSDKSIITKAETTISALQQSISWLAVGGKMSIMVYPGHQGGDTEAAEVILWLEHTCLDTGSGLRLEKVAVPEQPTAPILLKVEKL